MIKISRIIKTILMSDFIAGLMIAIKKYLSQKKLSTIHLRKVKLAQDLEANTH